MNIELTYFVYFCYYYNYYFKSFIIYRNNNKEIYDLYKLLNISIFFAIF
jgi:hypothetical protein